MGALNCWGKSDEKQKFAKPVFYHIYEGNP